MKGMITAPQPLAVEAGAQILTEGGNAIDAAIAAAFVQMVVDFHGKAGARVEPGMWEDIVIRENPTGYGYTLEGQVNERGYKAITTPGTVAGLYKAHTEYGTMPWSDLLQHGIRVATEGYAVSRAMAKTREEVPIGSTTSPWSKVRESAYDDGGVFVANPDMARTFSILAEGGAEVFYRGDLAPRIAEDIERGGGFVTLKDLNGYEVTVNEPICSDYRGYTVASNHPPGGGVTILQMLKILEGYDLSSMRHLSPEYIFTVSLAMKAAWADRANLVGDPAFVEVPIKDLLSEFRALEWRHRIDAREKFSIPRWQPQEPPDTTHLAVADGQGNVVGLTHSLGSSSNVVTQGLGFAYNNCMNCFNPVPGQVNSIEPGKSRGTGMAPTLIVKDGKPYFSVGAPGGTRIVTGILHAILNVVDHGMTATEAIAAPRFDCQSDVISAHSRIPPSVCEAVRSMGHDIYRKIAPYGGIGSVHGIRFDLETGSMDGGADPDRGGMALAVW